MSAPDRPTYRYGVVIGGGNYVNLPFEEIEPESVYMVETIEHAKQTVRNAAQFSKPYGAETGAGNSGFHTPLYGDEGDYAFIYPVQRDHPDFSEVLDEPGDRARHAFGFLSKDPSHLFIFGPKGGLKVERATP